MKEPTKNPNASGTDVWPEEIRLAKSKTLLDVSFDNGKRFSLSAELLRVESPSAEVQGHGPGQKVTPAGKKEYFDREHRTGWQLCHSYWFQ